MLLGKVSEFRGADKGEVRRVEKEDHPFFFLQQFGESDFLKSAFFRIVCGRGEIMNFLSDPEALAADIVMAHRELLLFLVMNIVIVKNKQVNDIFDNLAIPALHHPSFFHRTFINPHPASLSQNRLWDMH